MTYCSNARQSEFGVLLISLGGLMDS